MYKKILIISVLLISLMISNLFAEKTLERIANEKGVEGETLYNDKKFVESAQTFEAAIAKLNEAVKTDGIPLDNEKISRWYLYAFQGYYQGKKFEKALQVQNERIKLDPGSYKLISTKATLLKKHLNRVDKAIEVLKEYNTAKRSFKVEKKIASYYQSIEDYENAVVWYNKAYEQKQDATVIKKIAAIYLILGKNSEAITAYEDFIKTNPNENVLAKTYMNLGKLYEDMKKNSKSIENYEKSINLKYSSDIVLTLIMKYYEDESYDKALEKIAFFLENKPGNNDAIYYRAMIHFDRGEKKSAKADFQTISSDPRYSKLAKGYIESIESEGQTESSNTEEDMLTTLYSSGLLKKFKVDLNEAWVNPSAWESIDYDTKVGICIKLAQECDKAGSSGRITIINNMSGDKLAKYSQASGYKNLKK